MIKNHTNLRLLYFILQTKTFHTLFNTIPLGLPQTSRFIYLHPVHIHYTRSTCVSQHPKLRTRGLRYSKVLLPTSPSWQQPAHSD